MASKKTVLITGCSDDGIGSRLALVFQQCGHHVFATARNPAKMSKLKDLDNVTLLTVDVRDKEHINAAVEAVRRHTGGTLDYLVNNAGRNHFMPALDEDLDVAKSLFENNVWGPLALTQVFAPMVIEAKGSIVFITSISGYLNVPYIGKSPPWSPPFSKQLSKSVVLGTYAASKRSIELIAETLRLELSPFHVKVLSIVTGRHHHTWTDVFWRFSNCLMTHSTNLSSRRSLLEQRGEDGVSRGDLVQYCRAWWLISRRARPGKCGWAITQDSTQFCTSYLPVSVMVRFSIVLFLTTQVLPIVIMGINVSLFC